MNYYDFSRLFQRQGGYSLPVLIALKRTGAITWHFTNDKHDITYNNQIYKAVTMDYKFPTSRDGVPQGGTLEIEIDINKDGDELLRWFDELDHEATIEVVALINEHGEINKLSQLSQSHGNVTWDGEKISWQLGADDRMNMQINSWRFDFDALTG
jgi:hypothetical protein